MKRMLWVIMIAVFCLVLFSCAKKPDAGFQSISQEEAVRMMEMDDGHVIVDVRTHDEYREGHIPEAICIPNEEIIDEKPFQLPDLDQVILIYCRSGNRSRQAAKKLADMGYTKVYEFGGINTWKGEIETGLYPYERAEGASLTFEVDGRQMDAYFKGHAGGDALFAKLKDGSVFVEMNDSGDDEKTGILPWELPCEEEEISVETGTLVLRDGKELAVCYRAENVHGVIVAEFVGMTEEELRDFFKEGPVRAELFLNWWDY